MQGGFGEIILDLFFPPRCIGCGLFCDVPDPWWCQRCERVRTENPPRKQIIAGAVVYSAHRYDCGPVAAAIQQLKFFRIAATAKLCAAWLAPLIHNFDTTGAPIILLPVPLHDKRQLLRGFNQAEALCGALAHQQAIGPQSLMVDAEFIVRLQNTHTQVHSSREQRSTQLAEAFVMAPHRRPIVPTATYIFVDDVITTGSTLSACIKTIRAAGAARIGAITIAAA